MQSGRAFFMCLIPDGPSRPGYSNRPKRLPSKKWRELILQVWHSDPLRCPVCQNPMRVIAIVDDRRAVEKILRHLGLWCGGSRLRTGRSPPADGPWSRVPYGDVDPMPDYENVLTD